MTDRRLDSHDSIRGATDQARVDRVRWYHEFDFEHGVRARTSHENPDGVRRIWRFVETQLARLPFQGASVLDIGAWDGYWSFFAERHGAAAVLATDDATQRWADMGGIRLASELLGSRIDIREDMPVYELASLGRTFDVVLCLGVHYHLWDPLYAFAQIRHCCHPNTVVVVEGEVAWTGMHPNDARFFESAWQECVLPAPLLARLLRLAYLRVDETVWMQPLPDRFDPAADLRIERALMICRPFEGTNAAYTYRPHFGLQIFDDRFRGAGDVERRAGMRVLTLPEVVEAGGEFVARVEVTNVGSHPWRRLEPAGPAAILEGASHTRLEPLDYEAAFLAKQIVPGAYTNTSVATYRRYIESRWVEGTVALGVQLWDAGRQQQIDQDYGRGFLRHDVAPGTSTIVDVRLRAPLAGGRYTLRFDPVCEYVSWFASAGWAPLDVTMTVT